MQAERRWSDGSLEWRPLVNSRSDLVLELHRLGPRVCRDIGIPDWLIQLVDQGVTLAKTLTDTLDDRHWAERLDAVFGAAEEQAIEAWTVGLSELDGEWIERDLIPLFREAKLRFINRLVGQGNYDRLRAALADDAAATLAAIRIGLAQIRPLVVAATDASALLTARQLDQTGLAALMHESLLGSLIEIDGFLESVRDEVVTHRFNFSALKARGQDIADVAVMASTIRSAISTETEARLSEVGFNLDRKIRGAKDAMQFSADGPAQAASSLVELIEGLVRHHAPDDEVVRWVLEDYPGARAGLTFQRGEGTPQPSKRARFLHYLYRGRRIRATEPFSEAMAFAFINARNALEAIKHGDHSYDEAKAEVDRSLRALNGAITLLLRLRSAADYPRSAVEADSSVIN